MSQEITVHQSSTALSADNGVFSGAEAFESAQRMAKALISSSMVPPSYRQNLGDALVAIDLARRTGASPLMVMQNLHVIEGKPSWASQFIIAALNACGKFSPLRFDVKDLGKKEVEYEYWTGSRQQNNRRLNKAKVTINDKRFVASALDHGGDVLTGPEVTVEMAVKEGWYGKPGSKWKTMPDLMGRYRAAAFFGRLYAPEILMGIATEDETYDLPADQFQVVKEEKSPPPKIVDPVGDEATEEPKKPRATKAAKEQAGKDGYRAFHAGTERDDIPEDCAANEKLREAWQAGWDKADADSHVETQPEPEPEPEDGGAPFDPDHDQDDDGNQSFGFGE